MAGDKACCSIIWFCVSAVPVVSLCRFMAVMTCSCSVLADDNVVVHASKDVFQSVGGK